MAVIGVLAQVAVSCSGNGPAPNAVRPSSISNPPPNRAPIEGTVLYSDPAWSLLFVQDGQRTIRLDVGQGARLPLGRRIRAHIAPTGHDDGSTVARVEDLGDVMPPVARTFRPTVPGWVSVEGTVQRVWIDADRLRFALVAGGYRLIAVLPVAPSEADYSILGTKVRAVGVLADVEGSRQLLGAATLWIPSRQTLTILTPATPAEELPERTIADVLRRPTHGRGTERLRLWARIESALSAERVVLRDDTGTIQADIGSGGWLGDTVQVLGFASGGTKAAPLLEDAQISRVGERAPDAAPSSQVRGPVLTRVAEVRNLAGEMSRRGLPVRAEASITWLDRVARHVFVQDGNAAIYLWRPASDLTNLEPGDRVLVEGQTATGIVAPVVVGAHLTRLGKNSWPPAPEVSLSTPDIVDLDCRRVTVRGTVRAVRSDTSPYNAPDHWQPVLRLAATEVVDVRLPRGTLSDAMSLLDSEVLIRGTVHSDFSRAIRLSGLFLDVSRLEDVTVLEHPVPDPFELPVTGTAELFRTGNPQTWGHRLHVRGTVLLQRPGIVFLRDDDGSVVLRSPLLLPTRPGDILDAVGFPVPDAFAPGLDDASFRIYSHGAPPTPVDAAPAEILSGRLNANLVRVEGLVLDVVRTHARLTVLLEAQNSILSAVLDSDAPGPLVEGLEVGSRVRIAGVVGPTAAERLILRSSADLNLLATPPFWNPSRARSALAIFALLVCAAFLWALTLRKRVQAQTKTIGERLLERNGLIAELETRNAELERFTYTVSHDLKTPLVTIGGFLGLVEQDALAGNPQRLRADLKRISEATDKMRRLLDELLQLSRAGRRLNTVEALPLRPIVDEALSIVDARSSRVRVDVHSPLPTVLGDRGRLIEVFQNLLENAFKYAGNQEAPTVEIGCDGFDEKGHAKIFVRDNGIGIPPQFHSRIFELFEKLDPLSQGTGVGLALVRRIVDAHGGSVSVSSLGDGTGATFTLTLPVPKIARPHP